jgi:hypothetical protein
MNEKIRRYFEDICEKIRNSPGSVDTIFTSGTSILSENADQWIGFGVSNVSEIYSHLDSIIQETNQNHQKPRAGVFQDLLPILEDLAYHSAVFGIYFFSIEDILQQNITKNGSSRIGSSSNQGNVMHIAIEMPDNPEEIKNQFLGDMISEARQAITAFEIVFSSNVRDYPRQLLNLYELRRLLLSLEIRACYLKELWWRLM